jgi:hypothetical protein
VNQKQKELCNTYINHLRNPRWAYKNGVFRVTRAEGEEIASLLQSMLDEIDGHTPQAITLRDQFAIAIAGGFAANTERSALSMASAYEWADLALKGRGQ